ncbi:MAG: RNA methyltransferase [Betaproteobacteria bacterium]|nr:RNA methyltransferase [Betaproteobacteria bacterium]
MKALRSRDNPVVRQLTALAHSARERKKAGLTVLDGVHLVDAYRHARGAPRQVAIAESAIQRDDVRAVLQGLDDRTLVSLPDAFFRDISSLDTPSHVVALVETPVAKPVPVDATVLVLEDVQDPGNVGSLLRSAAAAGVTEVLTSRATAFCWSPKVLRAAQGAHFSLNIVEGADPVAWLATYAGRSLALVAQAQGVASLYASNLNGPVAFLLGNEGAGLSEALRRAATAQATLPMPGRIESLNVAAAGAICLFEMVRQRTK